MITQFLEKPAPDLDITGVAALNFNTSYQLYRRVLEDDPALKRARALLFMPEPFSF